MVDVACACALGRQNKRQAVEPVSVASGEDASAIVHRVEPPQQHPQRRGLQLVEAQVESNLHVHVLVVPAVVSEPAAADRDLVVVGEDGAPVAHRREVLRRVEGKGRCAAEAADPSPVPLGALRLGAVLEKPETETRGEVLDGREIRRLAVQVHGHEPDGPGRHLRPRIDGVDRVELVHVDEHGPRPGEADRLNRWERRMGRHQDLVARLHPERAKCQPERGGRRAGQHGVFDVRGARQLGLELAALRTQDVLARVDGGEHCPLELVVDRRAGQRNGAHGGIERRGPHRIFLRHGCQRSTVRPSRADRAAASTTARARTPSEAGTRFGPRPEHASRND